MKRFVSTALVVVLLLGLGTLAVLARGGGDILTPADSVVSAAAPDAPMAVIPKWNAIAMTLDSTASIPNAQGLANNISGTQQLLRWDASIQNFEYYIPGGGGGSNFNTKVGEPYLVLVDNTAPMTFSIVGDVPPPSGQQGAVKFGLFGGSPCKWNHITLPLDKSSIASAQDLAAAIGGVQQLLVWDASIQNFDYYVPGGGGGNNFATKIGYPYWVCMSASKDWP
jgi:hypothetical protein